MNEHKKPRGHKAHNDKDSILADAKNLLYILFIHRTTEESNILQAHHDAERHHR